MSCPEIGLHKSVKYGKIFKSKPITGLKMSCKSILGLSINM
jgi:hypothetical protein